MSLCGPVTKGTSATAVRIKSNQLQQHKRSGASKRTDAIQANKINAQGSGVFGACARAGFGRPSASKLFAKAENLSQLCQRTRGRRRIKLCVRHSPPCGRSPRSSTYGKGTHLALGPWARNSTLCAGNLKWPICLSSRNLLLRHSSHPHA